MKVELSFLTKRRWFLHQNAMIMGNAAWKRQISDEVHKSCGSLDRSNGVRNGCESQDNINFDTSMLSNYFLDTIALLWQY